jgi:tripartite-type tricarboxylate transporter receptor subunit TctC
VPQPAGGGADVLVRTIQQKMQELLGQPVFIDNKPGAAGNIGTIEGARSAPDGYTIVFVNMSTMAINPHVYTKPGFSLKDFMPVTNMASVTNLICVHPAVPAKTLKEFLDLARAKPGVLNYGTAGIGSENHLMGELLKSMAKVDIQHVPFRGGGPAVIAAVGGQVEAIVADPLSALTQVKAGMLRALAVTSAERVSSLPDVPTVAEGGVPGYAATGWRAAVLPVGTPPEVAAKIHAAITGALKDPQIAARLREQLYEPVGDTPEDFAKFIEVEDEKWSKLIAQIKLRIE